MKKITLLIGLGLATLLSNCKVGGEIVEDLLAPKIILKFSQTNTYGKLLDVDFNKNKANETYFDANYNFDFDPNEVLVKEKEYSFSDKSANVMGQVYRFNFHSNYLKNVFVTNRHIKEMRFDNCKELDTCYIYNAQDLEILSLEGCHKLKALQFSEKSKRYRSLRNINLKYSYQLQDVDKIIEGLPNRSEEKEKGKIAISVPMSPQQEKALKEKGWLSADVFNAITEADISKYQHKFTDKHITVFSGINPDWKINRIFFFKTRNGYLGKLQFLKKENFLMRVVVYTPGGLKAYSEIPNNFFNLETGKETDSKNGDFHIDGGVGTLYLYPCNGATFILEETLGN